MSVAGLLLYLVYINVISIGHKFLFKMLVNDCVVHRAIANERDSEYLKHDSNLLICWCADSEKSLNVKKCVTSPLQENLNSN